MSVTHTGRVSQLTAAAPIDVGASTGVVVVGHGSRDEVGTGEFLETVKLFAGQLGRAPVEPAFLELRLPDIEGALARVAATGVDQLVIVPLLLFAAGHAKRDIPAALARATRAFPGLQVRLALPLECHATLLELSLQRFQDALRRRGGDRRAVRLILVGRGSSDEAATADMFRYAGKLAAVTGIESCRVAFVAKAQPGLSEVLRDLAPIPGSRIVVQPHVLFRGEVLHEISRQVGEWAHRHPGAEVDVAAHLGASPLLAKALCDRVREALAGEPGWGEPPDSDGGANR